MPTMSSVHLTTFILGPIAAASIGLGQLSSLSPLNPPTGPGSQAPNLAPDGQNLILSWLEPVDPDAPGRGLPYRLQVSRLSGKSWSDPATVIESDELFVNWADFPSVIRSGDGSLISHWLHKSSKGTYSYDIQIARSTDDGATWSRLGKLNDDDKLAEHGFVSMLPTDNAVRAFWLDGRNATGHGSGAMSLRTTTITDTIAPSTLLDAKVCDCCATSAAMAPTGPIIAFRDRTEAEIRDISFIKANGNGWSNPTTVHADNWLMPGCPVNGPSIAAAEDRIALAWYTGAKPGPSVKLALAQDNGSFSKPITIDTASGESFPLGRVATIFDGSDAIVCWMNATDEAAAINLRRVANTGKAGPTVYAIKTDDSRASGFPQIVIRGDNLIIAWTQITPSPTVRVGSIPLSDIPAP